MSKESKRIEALVYHAKPTPGKIKVVPSKRYATQRDLSLVYSPGVADPYVVDGSKYISYFTIE